MASVGITELKAQLSKYLRMARRGVEVQVLERGVPIARLVGMPNTADRDSEVLERLVATGIARRGNGRVKALVRRRLPIAVGLLSAVGEDREDRV
jgi:prevent-host-death family protein